MGPWGVGGGGSVRSFGSLIRSWPASMLTLAALLHITSALPEVIKLGKNFLQHRLSLLHFDPPQLIFFSWSKSCTKYE